VTTAALPMERSTWWRKQIIDLDKLTTLLSN